MKTNRLSTVELAKLAMFSAIMAVCAWITVPAAVPFTMQTFAVFLSIAVLGGRLGSISVLIYLLSGALGIPVFSGFSGGAAVLFGKTGGYIIGFLFAALVMWSLEGILGRSIPALALSMAAGLLVCYAFGTVWFVLVYIRQGSSMTLLNAFMYCVLPYIIPDMLKIALALSLYKRLARIFV